MRQSAYIAILAVLVGAPAIASAATVTVADDTILVLPSDNSQYTLLSGSAFEQLFIGTDSSSFTFDMTAGQSVTLTSAEKRTLTSNPTFAVTCGTNQSSVTLTLPTGAPAQPVIVTPGSTCSPTGGGSPSIGQVTPTPTPASSGGGGSPPPPPAPAPVPPRTPAPATTSSSSAPGQTPAPRGASSVIPALVQSVFFKNLSPGNRGDAVRELQTLLRQDKTIYPQGIANGVFGPATARAVKKFQKKYGIRQTGTTGPLTRAKLMQVFGGQKINAPAPVPVPAPAPVPQPASRPVSSDTQALQNQLTQLLKQLQELQKNKK